METVLTFGQMIGNTLECGSKVKCMVKEYSHGLMVASILVITKMIRKTVMEFLSGLVVASTLETGKKIDNTDRAHILIHLAKRRLVRGKMERELRIEKLRCIEQFFFI